jgi:hypothetical protein
LLNMYRVTHQMSKPITGVLHWTRMRWSDDVLTKSKLRPQNEINTRTFIDPKVILSVAIIILASFSALTFAQAKKHL